MKDLKFTGSLPSSFTGTTFDVAISFRIDMITSHTNSGINFTVLSVTLDDNSTTSKNQHEEWFGAGFKKLPYEMSAFKDFAGDHGLRLTIADSTGEGLETLVFGDEEDFSHSYS